MEDIRIQELAKAKILPVVIPEKLGMFYEHSPVFPLGSNWFKDKDTGVCYRIERNDKFLVVAETRQSIKNTTRKDTYYTITCQCGAERTIKVQDKFQVRLCKECQLELNRHKRRQRYARQKERRTDGLESNNRESPEGGSRCKE